MALEAKQPPPFLFECFGVEIDKSVTGSGASDFDRLTADFAVLHICLPVDGKIHNH